MNADVNLHLKVWEILKIDGYYYLNGRLALWYCEIAYVRQNDDRWLLKGGTYVLLGFDEWFG